MAIDKRSTKAELSESTTDLIKSLEKEKELRTKLGMSIADVQRKINEETNRLDAESKKKWARELAEQERKTKEAQHKENLKNLKEEGDLLGYAWENAGEIAAKSASKLMSSLTGVVDRTMETYLSSYQSLSTHLLGSTASLNGITDRLNSVLSATGLVSQQAVYNNLTNLVKSGIVYNVEQRAFLQTLSQDMDLMFDVNNGTLTRLIRLQGEDSTANRMAIQFSLQQFLNKTYENSQYIKDVYSSVSGALLEMSSLIPAGSAVNLESTIQTWLGSYYSAGVSSNTVTSLASALNALGSGDISGLGSGISNLLLMGAARSGLDYGQLLNQGLSASDIDKIMGGVSGYITEMGGASSNVVKNQLAKLFGISVSDIPAMANMITTGGGVSSSLAEVFGAYESTQHVSKQISNMLGNMQYTLGVNMAQSPGGYLGYQLSKMIAPLGDMLLDWGSSGGLTGKVASTAGVALKYAPLLSILLGSGITTLGDIMGAPAGTLGGIGALWNALGGSTGNTLKVSSAGVSSSAYVGSGDASDMLSSSVNSLKDVKAQVAEGTEEDEIDHLSNLDDNVLQIYNYMDDYLRNTLDRIATSIENSVGSFGSFTSLRG